MGYSSILRLRINKILLKMNPENMGEHVRLRHSSLWRKPLNYQKGVVKSNSCHHQLNQLGSMGQSWRSRSNIIMTHSAGFRTKTVASQSKPSKALERILKVRNKQPILQKNFIKSLTQDAGSIDRSTNLLTGMTKLQKIGLLSNKELNYTKYPASKKYYHIYNDYHERVTNPGFSRNHLGKHYFK